MSDINTDNLDIDIIELDMLEKAYHKEHGKFFFVSATTENIPNITDNIDSIIPIPEKPDYIPVAKNIQYEIVEYQDIEGNTWATIIAKCVLKNNAIATVEHKIEI